MECFVLGCGGMMPMPRRRLSSVAVRREGVIYLFDCGEGTQIPYKELHLGMRALRVVAVSHLHADHVLGLPGMMMLRAQMPDPEPLTLLGPPGLGRLIRHLRADLRMYINYEVRVREWSPASGAEAYRDEAVRILWGKLDHTVLSLGYRLEEHPRPGRFDLAAAAALGLPPGPLYGRLQAGEAVRAPDGREVSPAQVMGPPRRGRRVAFIADTRVTPAMQPLLAGADVAFVESMFLDEHAADAGLKKHMTARQAATAAREAGVDRAVLIHFSPRYEQRQLRLFAEEAAGCHPRVTLARDGLTLPVPLPD